MAKGMEAIYSRTWTSPANGVSFNNIPQNNTDLLILISARSSHTSFDGLGIYFNGSQSPVSNTSLSGNGSSASSSRSTYRSVATMPGNDSTANSFASVQIYIPNYTSTSFKQILIEGITENNATAVSLVLTSHLSLSNAPITSFMFDSATAGVNQLAQTSVSIYGISR
jgi:hypothetical protein